MSYEKKYKKYKNKYLELKELSGGGWVKDKNYTYDQTKNLLVIINSENNTITEKNTADMKIFLGDNIKGDIKVIIDKSIERIEDNAFKNMNITDVNFDNIINTWDYIDANHSTLKYIGKYAFANNKLQYLQLPSSIREIDDFAFANNQIYQFYNYNYKNLLSIICGKNVFNNNKFNIDKDINKITTNLKEIFGNQTK